jgi:hypothetical protein
MPSRAALFMVASNQTFARTVATNTAAHQNFAKFVQNPAEPRSAIAE